MPTQEFISKFTADTTELEQAYAKIKTLEEEQAARSAILTENTLKIKKKALRDEEEVLQTLISSNSKNAEAQAEIDKQREESIKKIKELKNEVEKLSPATEKVTKSQEQLQKSIKRVESTLRGFAVTAAIAFGAAILKGVIDFAKGLFEASAATKAINAAMEEFAQEAGKALGKMREQFTELKKLTPGTIAWKNEIEKVNKQYGDMIKLGVDATLGDIEEAERLLTVAIREQIKEQVRRDAIAKGFADAEQARLNAQLARLETSNKKVLGLLDDAAAKAEETALKIEKGLEPTEFARQEQARADARQAELEAEKAFQDASTEQEKKAAEIKKQNAQKAADQIKANFEQAAKAIQALEDEIAKQEIEGIDDTVERAIRLADLQLAIAIRNAQDTITNEQQLEETIELLGKQFNERRSEIEREAQEKLAEEERERTIEARKTLHESLNEIEQEEREKTIEAVKTRIEAEKVLEERAQQARIDRFNASISAVNSLGDAFRSLSEIVGEETEKGAALAKVAALFDIAASQAVAIAKAIEMAAKVGAAAGPAGPILFAATLAGLLATTVANIASAKQLIDGTPLPRHAEGTSATRQGPAIVGERGPEIVMLPKGAAVFNNQAVRTERELIDAINDGTINDLIMRQYVYPAIMAHQVAQKARDKQELKETVSAYFDQAFDDSNLLARGDRQISLLKVIAARLKPKPTPAPRSRF